MSLGTSFRKVCILTVISALILTGNLLADSKSGPISCRAGLHLSNTSAYSHSTAEISVYIDNPTDSVLGFRFWLQFDRPEEVIAFRQSGKIFDTVGTLTSGWETISAAFPSGTHTDIQITGIANLFPPPITPGIPPQTGGTLIKLLADVIEIGDPFADSVVGVVIDPFYPQHLEIVLSDFTWFPWNEEEYLDTIGWICDEWIIDSTSNPPETLGCTNWVETEFPPWDDFIEVTNTHYVLDTTQMCLSNGSVNVLPPLPFLCGDLNGDGSAGNIIDLNFLINRIFRLGPESDPPEASDVNCDGGNGNIIDLNWMINRIFRNGPPVCSNPGC